jgi:hypothetical protein
VLVEGDKYREVKFIAAKDWSSSKSKSHSTDEIARDWRLDKVRISLIGHAWGGRLKS